MSYLFSELLNWFFKLFYRVSSPSINRPLLFLARLRSRGAGVISKEFFPEIFAHCLCCLSRIASETDLVILKGIFNNVVISIAVCDTLASRWLLLISHILLIFNYKLILSLRRVRFICHHHNWPLRHYTLVLAVTELFKGASLNHSQIYECKLSLFE